jgi:hypothetical protein
MSQRTPQYPSVTAAAVFFLLALVPLTRTYGGCSNFLVAPAVPVGAGPVAVAVADLNADGKSDLAVINDVGNSVSILLGSGTGTFTTLMEYVAGLHPTGIVAADLNRDGKIDLAVSNRDSGDVYVYLGLGDGRFTVTSHVRTGSQPAAIVALDIDSDGILDLAVATPGSTSLSILPGFGTGDFKAPVTYSLPIPARALTVGDIDGDGRLDVAAGMFASDSMAVLFATSFALPDHLSVFPTGKTTITAGLLTPGSIAAADFNGDRKTDVALTLNGSTSRGLALFESPALMKRELFPTVTAPYPGFFAVADLNGDGRSDIAGPFTASSRAAIRFSDGAGGFTPGIQFLAGATAQTPGIGDFNNDGRLDLAFPNHDADQVSIVLAEAGGGFHAAASFESGYTYSLADVNGDGRSDLVRNDKGAISARLATPSRSFGEPTPLVTGSGNSLFVRDLNRDGMNDLLIWGEFLSAYLSDGHGGFSSPVTSPLQTGTSVFRIADFDGDGALDLVTGVFPQTSMYLQFGDGRGGFGPPSPFSIGVAVGLNTVGDFDGDGRSDLALLGSSGGPVYILRGGPNGFAAPATLSLDGAATAMSSGDFNGDGRSDLAFAEIGPAGGYNLSVFLATGSGAFGAAMRTEGILRAQSIGAGDFDKDGRDDLIAGNNSDSDVVTLFLSDDSGHLAKAAAYRGVRYASVEVGDFNGDGKPDAALRSLTDQSLTILFGACSPSISSLSTTTGPSVGGQTLTIFGTNLGGATAVTLAGTPATIVANTATSITVQTGVHLPASGAVVVTVDIGGSTTAAQTYTYEAPHRRRIAR